MNENESRRERDIIRAVNSFLREGEELLWMGQPYTKVKYHPHIFMVIFPLFFLGFALFWTVMASTAGGPFGLFGIPFICVGGFLCYNSFFGARKRYQNTAYAVTSDRAMIVTATKHGINCSDFYFANLQNITLAQVKGDSGTIAFSPFADPNLYYAVREQRRYSGNSFQAPASPSLEMIEDVHRVYHLISDCIAAKRQTYQG